MHYIVLHYAPGVSQCSTKHSQLRQGKGLLSDTETIGELGGGEPIGTYGKPEGPVLWWTEHSKTIMKEKVK